MKHVRHPDSYHRVDVLRGCIQQPKPASSLRMGDSHLRLRATVCLQQLSASLAKRTNLLASAEWSAQ